MWPQSHALDASLRRAQQLGVPATEHLLIVRIAAQRLTHQRRTNSGSCCSTDDPTRQSGAVSLYETVSEYRCSTSRFGVGQIEGSNRTPLGLHRIAEKIGGGWPVGTVFKSRRPIGYTWQGMAGAPITTRILWLEGLEPGHNRGGKVDSRRRYIYIHGTGDESTLGRPASAGCVHLAADDLIPLYARVPVGTLVWITR